MKGIYDLYGQNTQVKRKTGCHYDSSRLDKQEANSSSNVGKIELENCFSSCSQEKRKKNKWIVTTSTVLASLELCNYIL